MLVLASASPRRAELLRLARIDFEIQAVDCDETWQPGESALVYAERVAEAKARLAARLCPNATILAADTTVWLDEDQEPLGKPPDRAAARTMLRSLTRGRPHRVTTACALLVPTGELIRVRETAEVHMRAFDDLAFARFIEPHLDAGEWSDKAGGYAIQGLAGALVERIVGSYTAIVGLPLAQVVAALEALG